MNMTRRFRRFVLTAHVTFSVGWLGTVAGFLALAVAGLTSEDAQMVRAAYLAMDLMTWFVILPLSFASPVTGLVLSLGTRWGLFRHYWILVKFMLIVSAVIVLLIHLQPISFAADMAAKMTLSGADVRGAQIQLVVAPVAALLMFLVTTTLAVYKPRGMTRYGWRRLQEQRTMSR